MTAAATLPQPSFPLTTGDLANRIGARLVGSPDVQVTGLSAIQDARAGDLTFISNRAYSAQWQECLAAAAVVAETIKPEQDDRQRPLMFVRDVDQAMMPLLAIFQGPPDQPEMGVHASAVVHSTAKIGQGACIGPHVSIGANAVIGDGVVLHPGVVVYAHVNIGAATVVHSNSVIRERCIIGRGVILHPNVSIGADGFGYRPAPDGRGLMKMPHIGNVIIEDDVEIGANSCIDRAKFGSTVIGAGTKIDNLVQIAHNCVVGRCCLIAGQSGLGGSVMLGDGVILAGAVGIVDHLTIGAGARIGARSLVTRDVPAGASWLGAPADDARSTLRQWALVRRLPELLKRLTVTETGRDPT